MSKQKILVAVASKNAVALTEMLGRWYEWATMRKRKQTLYQIDACFEKYGYLNFDRVKEFLLNENAPKVAQD